MSDPRYVSRVMVVHDVNHIVSAIPADIFHQFDKHHPDKPHIEWILSYLLNRICFYEITNFRSDTIHPSLHNALDTNQKLTTLIYNQFNDPQFTYNGIPVFGVAPADVVVRYLGGTLYVVYTRRDPS